MLTQAVEQPVGLPGDQPGQQAVMRANLAAVLEMTVPGCVRDLPFALPENATNLNTHPPASPPIVKHIRRHPWHLPNLWRHEVPD